MKRRGSPEKRFAELVSPAAAPEPEILRVVQPATDGDCEKIEAEIRTRLAAGQRVEAVIPAGPVSFVIWARRAALDVGEVR